MARTREEFKCLSCNGTYFSTTEDGLLYFHACSPIPNLLYQPNPLLPLFDPNPQIERPNRRDENVVEEIVRDANGKEIRRVVKPKSEGLGKQKVVVLTATSEPAPGPEEAPPEPPPKPRRGLRRFG